MPIRDALNEIRKANNESFFDGVYYSPSSDSFQSDIALWDSKVSGFLPAWNYPLETVFTRVKQRLFTGYPVVLKAPSETPLTYLSIAKLVEPYLPKGVFNVITSTGENEASVKEVMYHTEGMCSFTYCYSGPFCKETNHNDNSLQCNPNSYPILINYGNINDALDYCYDCISGFSGQWCNKMGYVLAQDGIYDRFVSHLADDVKGYGVGDPMDEDNRIGCLYNSEVVNNFLSLVDDAVSKGAKIVCGGKRHALGGTFVEPTVLADVNPSMRVYSEEIIGPLVPV